MGDRTEALLFGAIIGMSAALALVIIVQIVRLVVIGIDELFIYMRKRKHRR